MGKSKRIRSDRARDSFASPERFAKDDAAKKARLTTIVLIVVIAAMIVSFATLVTLNKTGTFLRSTVVFRSDNYEIDGAMSTYMYYYMYNMYYSYYGEYAVYFVSASTLKSSAEDLLVLCEAARAAGVELDSKDLEKIDKTIDTIKSEAKDAGVSVSRIYGSTGVNISDIRKVLELQHLASKFETQKSDALKEEYKGDITVLDKFFEDNKTTLFKGDYLSVSATSEDWQNALSAAKTEEEFKKIFIELYTKENFVGKYNTAAGVPAEKLVAALIDAVVADLKYTLLGTKPEGVTFADNATTVDRLKAIYNKAPATGLDGVVGLTALSSDGYKTLAAEVDELSASLKSKIEAESDKDAYIKNAVTEKLNKLYKVGTLPTLETVNKVGEAVQKLIGFVLYDIEIEGVELDDTDTITSDMLKKVYTETLDADVLKNFVTAAESLKSSVKSALTAKTDYAYPTVGDIADQKKEETTTAGTTAADGTTNADDTTAAETTTEAATTTKKPDTTAGTTSKEEAEKPAPEADLGEFDKWFFNADRAENDVWVDKTEKKVYFVTGAPKDKTVTKDVGHILVSVNKETAADTSDADEVAKVEKENEKLDADAKKKAEEILAEFLASDQKKETFETIANKYTEDSGVFYENVLKGAMVEEFENWIYDEARKAGDTGIVKTDYGYHVMYFIGNGLPAWQAETFEAKLDDDITSWKEELAKDHKVETNEKGLTKVAG